MIFVVVHMYRTSWVHHQEDRLYKQIFNGMFFMHLYRVRQRIGKYGNGIFPFLA